jgi:hypothetical protein
MARPSKVEAPNAPIVWLTASDIYNGTPFLFTYDTFAALCSDLDRVRLADAVAASAAFPVVFAPLMLAADAPDCGYRQPAWKTGAGGSRNAVAACRLCACAGFLSRRAGAEIHKAARWRADRQYRHHRLRAGARGRRYAAWAAVAGRSRQARQAALHRHRCRARACADLGCLGRGPGLPDLLAAVSDTAITSSTREGFDALELEMAHWRNEIVRYRCGLSMAEIRRHRGTLEGWDCRNVRLAVEHVSFRDLDPETKARLDRVPTRLALPQQRSISSSRPAAAPSVPIPPSAKRWPTSSARPASAASMPGADPVPLRDSRCPAVSGAVRGGACAQLPDNRIRVAAGLRSGVVAGLCGRSLRVSHVQERNQQ